jgi:hypothetical protein
LGRIELEHTCTDDGYVSFSVVVVSGGFSGASGFCLPVDSLRDAVSSLSRIDHDLSGSYQIDDCESDDFILLEYLSQGHLRVSGQVGGSFNNQYLRYEFDTEQTAMNAVVASLRSMLDADAVRVRSETAVDIRKKVVRVYLAMLVVVMAAQILSVLVGFTNPQSLFCFTASLALGVGCAYEYRKREEIRESLRGFLKNEAEAEQHYRYRLLLCRVKAIVTLVLFILAVYCLTRYGAR